MKRLLLFSIPVIIISCNKTNKKEFSDHTQTNPKTEQNYSNKLSFNDSIKQVLLDTTNTHNSPIRIISSKIFNDPYSDHKNIKITYKNVTKKDIKGIKFEWYCLNSFEKPASGKSFFVKGKSTGIVTDYLKKGKTKSKIWEDFSTDALTIPSVRAYEVIFNDGTTWKL